MSGEAIFFVVEMHNGRLMPSKFNDRLPAKFTGKNAKANGLVYSERLDDKPHLAKLSLAELLSLYERHGKLPPPASPANPVWPSTTKGGTP